MLLYDSCVLQIRNSWKIISLVVVVKLWSQEILTRSINLSMSLREYEICLSENSILSYILLFMYNRQHLISLLGYLWIGFVGGSISHGFFSGTRSIIMAILGIVMFIISEYLKPWEKDYWHLILGGLVYSVAVGMVSGGFQHFLDSPMRSLWIVPVGWVISTLIFPYKEWLTRYNILKSWMIWVVISIILFVWLYAIMRILPSNLFVLDDHHATTIPSMVTWSIETVETITPPHSNSDHH